MIKIEFSNEQISVLKKERFEYPNPRIQIKMEAVYLKAMGLLHAEIERLCGISRPSFAKYLHQYQENGIDGLKKWYYKGRPNELAAFSNSLEEYFSKHPPSSSNEAVEIVKKLTGVRRSPTQIREFMHSIGMKFRKIGFVPKGVENKEKQQEQLEYEKKAQTKIGRSQKRKEGGTFLRFSPFYSLCLYRNSMVF